MTRDEIIRMAREAGFSQPWTAPKETQERLCRFFNAAYKAGATAERERIIAANAPEIDRINAELSEWKKFPMAAMLAAEKAVDAAIALEQEECAKVCDDEAMLCEAAAQRAEPDEVSAIRSTAWKISVCATKIRARRQK